MRTLLLGLFLLTAAAAFITRDRYEVDPVWYGGRPRLSLISRLLKLVKNEGPEQPPEWLRFNGTIYSRITSSKGYFPVGMGEWYDAGRSPRFWRTRFYQMETDIVRDAPVLTQLRAEMAILAASGRVIQKTIRYLPSLGEACVEADIAEIGNYIFGAYSIEIWVT